MTLKAIKSVSALLIACAAGTLIYRLAYLPWRADVERKTLEPITMALVERQPQFGAVRARENAAAARQFLDRRGVHNTGLYMVAAANYQILDDLNDAAAMYRAALQYDRRPELYYNLGLVELNRGHKAEGHAALIEAAMFNPFLILDIPDLDTRQAIQDEMRTRRILPWLVK